MDFHPAGVLDYTLISFRNKIKLFIFMHTKCKFVFLYSIYVPCTITEIMRFLSLGKLKCYISVKICGDVDVAHLVVFPFYVKLISAACAQSAE